VSLGSLLFSKSRWGKLNTLRQELQQSCIHGKTKLANVPEASVSAQQWRYTTQTRIPAEIYSRDATNSQNDQVNSQGQTQSRHNYTISTVAHGCLYTNNVNHRTIYNANGVSIPELSFNKSGKNKTQYLRHPVSRHVPGLSASVFGTVAIANGNYGHWMIDGLSRLLLMKQTMDMSAIEYIATPKFRYDFQKESLVALGFRPEQFVEIDALECVQFEKIVCTSAPRGDSSTLCPGWIVDEYRRTIPNKFETQVAKKRLYVSRKDASSRKLINEDTVIALLERYGFESVQLSEYNFNDKIALFQQSECVIGLTGAGLTNIMFCNKGTKLLELFPPSFIHYLYSSIATHLEFDYQFLTLTNASSLSRFNKYFGDLHIDIDLLEKRLQTMGL